jgi:hypothetical protein
MHVRVKKSDSTVLNNGDVGLQVHSQLGRGGPKRPVVRVAGDPLGLPPELGHLLRDCGCSAFLATGMAASQDGTHAEPDLTVVNFATNQAANRERAQALRERNPKPVVCLLWHPTEQSKRIRVVLDGSSRFHHAVTGLNRMAGLGRIMSITGFEFFFEKDHGSKFLRTQLPSLQRKTNALSKNKRACLMAGHVSRWDSFAGCAAGTNRCSLP